MTVIETESRPGIKTLFEEQRGMLYALSFYAAGLFFGAFFYPYIDEKHLRYLTQLFLAGRAWDAQAVYTLIAVGILYLLTLLLGFSIFGFAFIDGILFICGMGIAVISASLTVLYGFKGFSYTALLIAPQAAAFLLLFMAQCTLCNRMSRGLFHFMKQKTDTPLHSGTPAYLKKLIFLFFLFTVVALLGASLTYLVSPLFHFT